MKHLSPMIFAGVVVWAFAAQAGSPSHGTSPAVEESGGHGAPAVQDSGGHGAVAAVDKSSDEPAGHGGGSAWSYAGRTGPAAWGKLGAKFRACGAGRMQSPIDFGEGLAAEGEGIEFDFRPTALSILHNGHTVQVNYAPGSGITVGGKSYDLLQFHFHTPSEHTVGGAPSAMEVHFVHQDASGALAVVGVLIEAGEENLALREIWAAMPKRAGPERAHDRVVVNARDLLPDDVGYYRYMGSLTTPPCSEGVNWYVMAGRIEASMAQIEQFAAAAGANARPVQALNHRLVVTPLSID